MSYTTTQVRHICESLAGYDVIQDGANVKEVIEKAIPKIFDFDFPFYDETKRAEWEYNFLLNFYTREISGETFALWKLWLNQKLNKIMPKYNPLYKAFAEGFNAFYTMSTTESVTGNDTKTGNETSENKTTTAGTGTGHSQTNSNGQDDNTTKTTQKHSDTPQGSVTDLDSGLYMSDATIAETIDHTGSSNTTTLDSNSTRNDTTTATGKKGNTENTDRNETRTKTGYDGRTIAEMMKEYADNMSSIDNLIYTECADLFIQYYGGVY